MGGETNFCRRQSFRFILISCLFLVCFPFVPLVFLGCLSLSFRFCFFFHFRFLFLFAAPKTSRSLMVSLSKFSDSLSLSFAIRPLVLTNFYLFSASNYIYIEYLVYIYLEILFCVYIIYIRSISHWFLACLAFLVSFLTYSFYIIYICILYMVDMPLDQ